MAGNNLIQFLRSDRVSETSYRDSEGGGVPSDLLKGQPFYDIKNNRLYIGHDKIDGETNLRYLFQKDFIDLDDKLNTEISRATEAERVLQNTVVTAEGTLQAAINTEEQRAENREKELQAAVDTAQSTADSKYFKPPSGIPGIDIASGTITDSNISSGAAIQQSKISGLTSKLSTIESRLNSLGFSAGALSLAREDVLYKQNDDTFTESVPGTGGSETLYKCNYYIKSGNLCVFSLRLEGVYGISNITQVDANAALATIPYHPLKAYTCDGSWQETHFHNSTASGGTPVITDDISWGTATFTISTSGVISCNKSQVQSYSSTVAKSSVAYTETRGYCVVSGGFRIS